MKRTLFIAIPFIAFVTLTGWKKNPPVTTEPVKNLVTSLQKDVDFIAYAETQFSIVKETYTAFKENATVKSLVLEMKTATPERKQAITNEVGQLAGVSEKMKQAAVLFKTLNDKLKNEYKLENKDRNTLLKQAFSAKLAAAKKSCIGEIVSLMVSAGNSYYECMGSGGPFIICWTMLYGELIMGLIEIEQNNPGCMEWLMSGLM
jgi:hypothetical protein